MMTFETKNKEKGYKGPFTKGEGVIAKDPEFANYYARNVLKGPFPKGEEIIAKDLGSAYHYAKDVLKLKDPESWRVVKEAINEEDEYDDISYDKSSPFDEYDDISYDKSSPFYAIQKQLNDVLSYYNNAYEQEKDPELKKEMDKRYGKIFKAIWHQLLWDPFPTDGKSSHN